MLRRLAPAAIALAALAAATPAVAETTRAKVVQTKDNSISCYATVPIEGRGIVCGAESLKPGPKTHGLDPFLSLKPRGKAVFGGRGDYGGYNAKPVVLKLHDQWKWHGITCTLGKDGMTCLNKDDRGFNVGPAGYTMLP